MLRFPYSSRALARLALAGGIVAVGAIAWPVRAPAQNGAAPPDLSGFWTRSDDDAKFLDPPSGPGPVQDDPKYPHQGRITRANGGGNGDVGTNGWVGDDKNPILKPWAADIVRKNGAEEKAGHTIYPSFTTCRPAGVPFVIVLRAEPIQFLQARNQVTIIYQRDQQVRRVYMNRPHSKAPTPSYYGESVGHYEGDTLVIDTIGMNDKTWTDRYGTPHTKAMHVVERYRMTNQGKSLQVGFTVDDPNAFTTPWSAVANYRRGAGPFQESVCAENARDANTLGTYEIPTDANYKPPL